MATRIHALVSDDIVNGDSFFKNLEHNPLGSCERFDIGSWKFFLQTVLSALKWRVS
jgi:hypothetical protein